MLAMLKEQMSLTRPDVFRTKVAVGCLWIAAALSLSGQTGAKNGEWPTYGGDLGSTRYSALDQIRADNFNKLEVAWRFKTDALGPRPEFQLEATPLMVKGVLYSAVGTRRSVVAIDAATGELLWTHGENEGVRGSSAPRQLSGRGIGYWTDGKEERILYVTPGYRLIALDAKTGARIKSFGTDGVVDLKLDDDQEMDLVTGSVGYHAAPVVVKNVVIIGAAHLPGGTPKTMNNVRGYVRGFDVHTGKRLWIFHTIPRPGEYGLNTWEQDSWNHNGNTGVWGQISVDEELNLVYLPVELPTGDYYGGHRPGAGLFGESLVAVDLQTGKRKWHYQFVHHGIWDMDIPCAPMLVNFNVNGKLVKAVAQPTKQSFLYVFDRATGQPIWPMEERPVPKGDVPGEWYSPTQPFPTKPPAYNVQGISQDDLIDFTPELRAEAIQLVSHYKIGPLFTPPSVSKPEGPRGTIQQPGALGGANWPGGSWDPETHILYVFSQTRPDSIGLVPPDPGVSDMNYIQGDAVAIAARKAAAEAAKQATTDGKPAANRPARAPAAEGGGGGALTVRGLPLMKPPYGRITAINLDKADIQWTIAHGETPDIIRNNPALKGLTIPRTGRPGILGVLTTKSLVIAGEAGFFTTPSGVRGAMLRAYDKGTGKEVGAVYMPAPQSGSPMTYMLNGQQYLVVAISGAGYSGELVAFKLPPAE